MKPDGKGVEEVWRSTALEIHWTTPILHDGYVYAFSGRNEPDARFRCVEFATGKVMWDRDESWPPHSTPTPPVYGRGSALLADGKLIVLGEGEAAEAKRRFLNEDRSGGFFRDEDDRDNGPHILNRAFSGTYER